MTMTGNSPYQPEETAVCWLCSQHSARSEHHALDADHYQPRECADSDGAGVVLCPMCHDAVHRWMRAHGTPGGNAAAAALEALLGRFTTALLT